MVVPEQVQETVEGQRLNLSFQRVAVLFRLAFRHAFRDDNVAEKASLVRGERQHVRYRVLAAKLAVEGAHASIGDKSDAQLAARRGRRNLRQELRESRRTLLPVRTGDVNA
jgi:hypothetical protein